MERRILRRRTRWLSPVLVWAVCLCCAALSAGPVDADGDRSLQPLPPKIVFPDPEHTSLADPDTAMQVRDEIESSFADLNKVITARTRLVQRFGLVAAPALINSLRAQSKSVAQSHTWNAALTLAALRDVMGPADSIQRALLPLQRMLSSGGEAYGRAFAALAIGCYPWTEGRAVAGEPAIRAVPGPGVLRKSVRTSLKRARASMADQASSADNVLGRACVLALAKMGGKDAAEIVCSLESQGNIRHRQALLIARAFSHADTPKQCFASLRAQQDEAVAAALSISVALLVENRRPWTRDSKTILEALARLQVKNQKREVAEALFARGVIALVNGASDREWDDIWKATIAPKVETVVSEAGAQAMLFCHRGFFREQIVRGAASTSIGIKPAVRSMLLLRAGELATPEAIQACLAWIPRARRPWPTKEWDPRWYAVVGLLRAAHHERLTDPVLRKRIVKVLENALKNRIFAKHQPFQEALGNVLKQHGPTLIGASRLIPAALRDIERSMPDQWGLLAGDPRDLCAFRVNRQIEVIFDFGSIRQSTVDDKKIDKQGERYLKRYLDRYPYFSRLQFLSDRGTRPLLQFDDSDPEGLDR